MKLTAKSKKNLRVLKLFIISLIFVTIAVSVAIIACNYIGNRNFKESFYAVSSLKVNNKIRVIQISDLHNSLYGKDNEKLIDRIGKLKPDIIVYTGDCLDSKSDDTRRIINLCTELSKIAPSYYIYGNNEVEKYYDFPLNLEWLDYTLGFDDNNRDPQALIDIKDEFAMELEASGITVLKNEFSTITIGANTVDIYGVLTSNPSAFWEYCGESFEKYLYTNESNLKITLIHEPLIFEEFTPDSWGDLMLAGHYHGGTVKIPMLGPLYTHEGGFLPQRSGHYVFGRYDVQGSPMIISSGMDNKNILRINNEPELVIIDINKF